MPGVLNARFSVVSIFIAASLCSCNFFSNSKLPSTDAKGIARVWAIDDGEKIKRDDLKNSLADDPANTVWKNNAIHVFGGKNEIVAFQLIIEADSSGAEKVNVTISDLTNGVSLIPGSAKGTADPFDYRDKNIELFTQHYMNFTKRSPPLWFFAESAAPSAYYSGWLPDCLIPFSAPAGKGGAPFSVKAKNNQGIWVDILIPASVSPGLYSGQVDITVSDKLFTTIPISLNVYDFTLSDTTHLKNMFGFAPGDLAQRHGVAEDSPEYYDIEARYHQMAHRHRFDLQRKVDNLTEMTQYHKRYLTGELYTPGKKYAGPGEGVGNTSFSIGFYGQLPDEYGSKRMSAMNEAGWQSGSDAWENWFIANAPLVQRHKYLYPDEPEYRGPEAIKGTTSMDTIRMQARWTHNNPGTGKNIPTLVTSRILPDFEGYIDFWSVASHEVVAKISAEQVASEKSKGRLFGIYNGYRPGMGAVISDADAVEFRVMPWIIWKYNVDQYFYWATTLWTDINVFVNPETLNEPGYHEPVNGDGTFLYPGEDKMFPSENRNLAGPLSSIRAKNWRRGSQDYEYLWLARKAGFEKELKKIVDECVPTALWEAKSQKNISWSSRGHKFDEYRKRLAELLSTDAAKNILKAK